ncbi:MULTISPECIES: SDR family NAD(P)-dependent oxidoreductase [Protofrankia]|uniref:3-oxoacyl-(Acyl-carrier-protein) reductase n=1 Tax=Candidatus Protofrankia datiscae TaxID=2716812 RepID=F8B0P4_9ACTN|nr:MULTISPECIES: SDR family oxidoreductase [Protofrankia]AEH10676.1 3-oxoacyl-(acyl-carrier-protein) reductase [Candidatus Protofrankia datiscae]
MDLQLDGRRAIVTGGSRGIGRAIARSLAAEGAKGVIAARDADVLAVAARQLAAETGGTVLPVAADTRDGGAVARLAERTVAELGGVDILVNNAAQPGGAGGPGGFSALATADLADDIDVKVIGYLRTAQAVAPHLIRAGWGRIINIGGLAARSTGRTAASIRNASVTALTKNLADELGPHGINVVAVHPGPTVTERFADLIGDDPARLDAVTATLTIGRVVTAEEVATLVTFLASPLSVSVTGETIACGGGSRGPIYY